MDKEAKAIDMLRSISKKGDCFFYATVTKITGDTCSVKIAELELSDVRIKATNDGSADKLTVTPLKGSKVIVGCNNGDLRDLFLVKVDKAALISYKQNGLEVEIDSQTKKIDIKNSSTSLTKLMTSLYDIISKLTVQTPSGSSTTPLPPTIMALEKFKTDFQMLLK